MAGALKGDHAGQDFLKTVIRDAKGGLKSLARWDVEAGEMGAPPTDLNALAPPDTRESSGR